MNEDLRLQADPPVQHLAFAHRDHKTFSSQEYWWKNRGGLYRSQPSGNTVLGTLTVLHFHVYPVFKIAWRGQSSYSYVMPVMSVLNRKLR